MNTKAFAHLIIISVSSVWIGGTKKKVCMVSRYQTNIDYRNENLWPEGTHMVFDFDHLARFHVHFKIQYLKSIFDTICTNIYEYQACNYVGVNAVECHAYNFSQQCYYCQPKEKHI